MSEEKLTLGQYFKREREQREITLKEIEQRTKIPAQTLKFLEEDQINVLPPRAFLRGFLQVISKEFGFDEEELVRHLDETLSAHGKMEEGRGRFMRRGNKGKSIFLRILMVVVLAFFLVVIAGLAMRTCSQTHQGAVGAYALEQPGNPPDAQTA